MIHISFAACMVSASRRLALDVKASAIQAILRSALLEGLIAFVLRTCWPVSDLAFQTEEPWMIVSSQLFEDYIECATKCWLRSRAEPAAGNVYAEWARAQNEAYRQDALKRLSAVLPEGDRVIGPPISKSSKDATWRIAIDVRLRTNELESRLHAVEKIASEGRGSI